MNDALLMSGLERVSDLAGDGQRFIDRDGGLRDPVRERGSVDELRSGVSQPRGGRLCLGLKPDRLRDTFVGESARAMLCAFCSEGRGTLR